MPGDILTKMNKEYEGNDSLEDHKILHGDVREQLKISQIFVSNMAKFCVSAVLLSVLIWK